MANVIKTNKTKYFHKLFSKSALTTIENTTCLGTILCFQAEQQSVCSMIRARRSFHLLSSTYLPQRAYNYSTIKNRIRQESMAFHRKYWKKCSFPFKMADNRYKHEYPLQICIYLDHTLSRFIIIVLHFKSSIMIV